MDKLYFYGVRGSGYELLKSYLSDRRQYVEFEGHTSNALCIEQGVPQGSVLGPLLFIIYMNDLAANLSSDEVCLYADDTSILVKGETREEMLLKAKIAMQEAEDWFAVNNLSLNKNKTQHLEFTTRKLESIEIKLLGLHLDSGLDWSAHVAALARKLSAAIFSLRRIKQLSNYQAAYLAYISNFHSVAVYGIEFWGRSAGASRIYLLQKKAIRLLSDLRQDESCREAFCKTKILTLQSEYILRVAKHVHSNNENFSKCGDTHSYATRYRDRLKLPYHRIKKTQKYADYWGCKIYNHLPLA
jgi:hypothetical protein